VQDVSQIATERGEMSQDSRMTSAHHKPVSTTVIDPAARSAKRGFQMLSASSVGLEMGLSVLIGVLAGVWIDSKTGTSPLFLLIFLAFGFIAGFRGVIRAVKRADREAQADTNEAQGHQ
jgi:ATP synthase protein I